MSVLVVTGTGTDVGKTVVAAALAALARDRGSSVAVVKPAQTGVREREPGDVDEVARLAGDVETCELARYPDPLSPAAAARLARAATVTVDAVVSTVKDLASRHRLVIVEGAGGLLVRFDDEGTTLADVARALDAPLVVVARPSLGTLNETALTLEAMAHRGLELSGLVIGSWPAMPDLTARSNIRDLETLAARPLAGALPAGAGDLDPDDFLEVARGGLGPSYGGRFDATDFKRRHDPMA